MNVNVACFSSSLVKIWWDLTEKREMEWKQIASFWISIFQIFFLLAFPLRFRLGSCAVSAPLSLSSALL